jgi:16S rRNA (cytidine1402-2'-O)-methyltransferase
VAAHGTLYLVATPLGNDADLTFRALRVLRQADAVIVEERRVGASFLARFQISKPIYEWNEHSPAAEAQELVAKLLQGQSLALISDHGTPLIQDPGADLVAAAIAAHIRVEPIPGPSAILAALVASGLPTARFRFIGQLPPKTAARLRALGALRALPETLVILDAPYRLAALLTGLRATFGDERRAAVACELTLPTERFVRGTLAEIQTHFVNHPFKGEFVVLVEGLTTHSSRSPS